MHAADLLTNRARLTPDREALLDESSCRRYTYGQLNERANRAANMLANRFGVRKGDRVSILANNDMAHIDLLFGLGKIGAVMAPLNWRLAAAELRYIITDANPKALIIGPEFVNIFDDIRADVGGMSILALKDATVDGAVSYEGMLGDASPREPARPPLDGDDPYALLYTSGTTGAPKGAIIPHRQILWNCLNTVSSWGLSEYDVSPVFTPLFHAGGLFAFLTPLIYVGGRLILSRTFDAEETLKTVEAERCTVVLGVPTLFTMWRESSIYTEIDLSSVRWLISGGAPCPPSIMDAWREEKGVVFRQGYGLTEVGPNCFSMTDEDSTRKTGSVGKPIFHSQMKLVGPDGQEVPDGETGELAIAGPHVCLGYWRKPDATKETLRDGWFHTGDMARRDEEGFYTIAGRFKDMIISGGENIYAAEVEAVFRDHPDVADAALIGKPNERWGEVGLMIVVRERNSARAIPSNPDEEDILGFAGERLARYKIPKEVVFADELPYSSYGKVQKSELKRKYL